MPREDWQLPAVRAQIPEVEQCRKAFGAEAVGQALYGLQNMEDPHKKKREKAMYMKSKIRHKHFALENRVTRLESTLSQVD